LWVVRQHHSLFVSRVIFRVDRHARFEHAKGDPR
jgi:hypothetical protein